MCTHIEKKIFYFIYHHDLSSFSYLAYQHQCQRLPLLYSFCGLGFRIVLRLAFVIVHFVDCVQFDQLT